MNSINRIWYKQKHIESKQCTKMEPDKKMEEVIPGPMWNHRSVHTLNIVVKYCITGEYIPWVSTILVSLMSL